MTQFPYFDFLFQRLESHQVFAEAFKDHVHWGLFEGDPLPERVAVKDFNRATENLSRKLVSMSGIADGMSILDVGCGFGGTARFLASSFPDSKVTALNIDGRQLERAKSITNNPRITFVEGNACEMPFENDEFDRLLAVESVFHFPSRLKFLKEARRVLKPGGLLVMSDFVVNGPSFLPIVLRTILEGDPMGRFYGRVNATTLTGYRFLAAMARLRVSDALDVTERTLPTYNFLRQLAIDLKEVGTPPDNANRFMELLSRKGQLRYVLLRIEATKLRDA